MQIFICQSLTCLCNDYMLNVNICQSLTYILLNKIYYLIRVYLKINNIRQSSMPLTQAIDYCLIYHLYSFAFM
ncbi:hypothetical protein CNEO2_320036 [Clostridium neonatale]|nr:hypothetical protein CNEO2_220036 [Clostridium neonatale]CAI3241266.1 hypothetical protein CNEO2_320036 [Clostridium neonatale]